MRKTVTRDDAAFISAVQEGSSFSATYVSSWPNFAYRPGTAGRERLLCRSLRSVEVALGLVLKWTGVGRRHRSAARAG